VRWWLNTLADATASLTAAEGSATAAAAADTAGSVQQQLQQAAQQMDSYKDLGVEQRQLLLQQLQAQLLPQVGFQPMHRSKIVVQSHVECYDWHLLLVCDFAAAVVDLYTLVLL
jgi:hypothetical protein